MLRSLICSARRAPLPSAFLVGAIVVGIAAEAVAFEWRDVRHWAPDLLVGVTFAGAGASAMRRRGGTGALLAGTGLTWFFGNFSSSLLHLHRGLLVHVLLTYPGWRPRSRAELVAVSVGYAAAVVTPVWRSDAGGMLVAVAVVGFATFRFLSGTGRVRRDRLTALQGAVAFAVAVVGGSVVRLGDPSGDAVEPMLLVYQAALCGIAVVLATRLRPAPTAVVADLVVELGEAPSDTLRDALASKLRDPTLVVGYRSPAGGYVDGAGTTVVIPPSGAPRVATYIDRDGSRVAVLVHDASVLDEPALVAAVAAATRLSAANAALLDELRAKLEELTASRRRLVLAADEERRRLETRLRQGAEGRVLSLAETLGRTAIADPSAAADHVRRAEAHLVHTSADLRRLARGLHPPELDEGLRCAVAALAERYPLSVELSVEGVDAVVGDVAIAGYYACAEALANATKHAAAAHVSVNVSRLEDRLVVQVVDDGVGGADPAHGSGLRGLADRVEALGGTLAVESPVDGGTRLTAELPLDRR